MQNFDLPVLDEDPHAILGVRQGAGAEEIRAAYIDRVREYPPERYATEFERVRDAYAILCDPGCRTRMMLRSADPEASLVSLLEGKTRSRYFAGPHAWLAAMREK